MNTARSSKANGFALLEALIALLITALGIIGIIKFQGQLFQNGAIAKQRSIAVGLAQERMEEIRAFVSSANYDTLAAVDGTPNDASYGTYGTETTSRDGTTFTRLTQIATFTQPYKYLDVLLTMSWTTPANTTESIQLRSAVAWTDPTSEGTLLSNTTTNATGNCLTQTLSDSSGICSGTAAATTNGTTVTVNYSAGGSGSGQFLCSNGAFSQTSSTCNANCLAGTVTDSTCSATVPATAGGANVSVTYTSGGTGSGVWACNQGAWSKVSGSCSPLNCTTPWGTALSNGGSVTAYSSSAPTTACSTVSQTRTCNNGTLSGSYTFQSCSEPCNVSPFGAVASGASVTAYQYSSGTTCPSETRTCNNGTLSGSYGYASCSLTSTGCVVDGVTYANGATKTFYKQANYSNNSCAANSQTFTCNGTSHNFELSGQTNVAAGYPYSTCTGPCTYSVNLKFNNSNQFCSNPVTSPSGLTCTLSSDKKTASCTGGILNLNSSVTISDVQVKSGSSCNEASSVSCTPALTCGSGSVSLSTTCTVTP